MLSLNALSKVLKKCIGTLICTTWNRTKKSASSIDYVKAIYINVLFLKEIKNDILTEILLIND